MRSPTFSLVTDIRQNVRLSGEAKISRLFAIAMIDYRGPVGDAAWEALRSLDLPAREWVSSLAFLTGAASANPNQEAWSRMVPELHFQ